MALFEEYIRYGAEEEEEEERSKRKPVKRKKKPKGAQKAARRAAPESVPAEPGMTQLVPVEVPRGAAPTPTPGASPIAGMPGSDQLKVLMSELQAAGWEPVIAAMQSTQGLGLSMVIQGQTGAIMQQRQSEGAQVSVDIVDRRYKWGKRGPDGRLAAGPETEKAMQFFNQLGVFARKNGLSWAGQKCPSRIVLHAVQQSAAVAGPPPAMPGAPTMPGAIPPGLVPEALPGATPGQPSGPSGPGSAPRLASQRPAAPQPASGWRRTKKLT
jgi:hypothetical protein